VVHPEDRHVEGEGEGARRGRDGPKAWPQAGTLGEGHQVDVGEIDPRDVGGLADQGDDDLGVVVRRLPGMDAPFLGLDHVVDVREHAARLVDDPHAARVGRALDAERPHRRS